MVDLSPTIGKIDGVEVQLHWSFILLLLAILFTSIYFFTLWILLFICVLVHEMVHAVIAKRNKIRVKRIVLYPFGGGTIIDQRQLSPAKETRISISGPIASLVIGLAFGLLSLYVTSGTAGQLVSALFELNILLGVFNLLPWLPLDGGRALRSYFQKTMDYLKATRKAVLYSNIMTVTYLFATTAYALLNNSYTVSYKEFFILINIIVAMFIYAGAESELGYALMKETTKGMRVRDAMTGNYLLVQKKTTIDQLRKRFRSKKAGAESPHNIIFMNGKDLNVLAISKIAKVARKKSIGKVPIANFGVKIPIIEAREPLYKAIDQMNDEGISILGVTAKGKIRGILQRQRVEYMISLRTEATDTSGKTLK